MTEAASSLWRRATPAEVETMCHTTGGCLPPGTYHVFGGEVPHGLASQVCGLLASIDHATPARRYCCPVADSDDWAELWRLSGRLRPRSGEDCLTFVAGVGRPWSPEIRVTFEPAPSFLDPLAGFFDAPKDDEPLVSFSRRRQGLLESSAGFFAPEDY